MAGAVQIITQGFPGLQAGRLVNFVTKSGYIRPLLVLIAWEGKGIPTEGDPAGAQPKLTGVVNGIVFRDGSNDDDEFVKPDALSLPAGSDGGSVVIPPAAVRLAEWATSITYNGDRQPGTWHWPPKADSAILFVSQDQLTGLLQTHDEQMEVKIKQWLADFKEQQTEDDDAVVEVEGLPPEIQEMNALKETVAQIQETLKHHGINGPAAATSYIGSEQEAQRLEEKANLHTDSIVQAPGHTPASGQVQIGGASVGANPDNKPQNN